MHFATDSGLVLKSDGDEEKEPEPEINLQNLRTLHRVESDPGASGPTFKRGDTVTVVRRMSWLVPHKTKEEYRRDIPEGTEGIVEGFADPQGRKVLVKVNLSVPGEGKKDVTHEVTVRNLQLSTEYNKKKEAKPVESGTPSSGSSGKGCPAWLLEGSDESSVKIEAGWHKLLSDNDDLNKNFWVKGRVATALEALHESLPTYTDKDLVVCHRMNEKGIWKDELWTKKDFKANELLFAPLVSQVKETHLTLQSNVVLQFPRHGRGATVANQVLALDGRGKTSLAKAGSLDASEHKGTLFWLVNKTIVPAEGNMVLQPVHWEHHVTLHMPFKKKKLGLGDLGAAGHPDPREREGHQGEHKAPRLWEAGAQEVMGFLVDLIVFRFSFTALQTFRRGALGPGWLAVPVPVPRENTCGC